MFVQRRRAGIGEIAGLPVRKCAPPQPTSGSGVLRHGADLFTRNGQWAFVPGRPGHS